VPISSWASTRSTPRAAQRVDRRRLDVADDHAHRHVLVAVEYGARPAGGLARGVAEAPLVAGLL
jgi:hypothetical protein